MVKLHGPCSYNLRPNIFMELKKPKTAVYPSFGEKIKIENNARPSLPSRRK
jgi:hypothetical protein